MRQTNTRAMVETAFLAAIVVVLTVIGASLPVLSLLATIVAPAAIATVGIRWGVRYSCSAAIVAFVIVSILLGPLTAVGTILMYAVPSIFIGLGFRKRWSPLKLILVPTLALAVTTIITLLASMSIMSVDLQTSIQNIGDEVQNAFIDTVKQQSLPPEQTELYIQQIQASLVQIKRMLITYAFCAFAVTSYILARFTAYIAKRTNNPVQPLPAISTWQIPVWTAGVLAVGLIIIIYGSSFVGINNELLTTVGMNIALFGAFACGLNGIASLLGVLEGYGVSRVLKIVIIALLYVMMPISLVTFGVMDMFLDLRSRFNQRGY